MHSTGSEGRGGPSVYDNRYGRGTGAGMADVLRSTSSAPPAAPPTSRRHLLRGGGAFCRAPTDLGPAGGAASLGMPPSPSSQHHGWASLPPVEQLERDVGVGGRAVEDVPGAAGSTMAASTYGVSHEHLGSGGSRHRPQFPPVFFQEPQLNTPMWRGEASWQGVAHAPTGGTGASGDGRAHSAGPIHAWRSGHATLDASEERVGQSQHAAGRPPVRELSTKAAWAPSGSSLFAAEQRRSSPGMLAKAHLQHDEIGSAILSPLATDDRVPLADALPSRPYPRPADDSPHTGIPTVGTGRGTGSRSLFWATVLHPNDVHEADVPPASTPSVDSCKLEEPLSGGSAARVLHCLPAAETHVPRAGGPVPASQQWLPSLPSAPHAPGTGHHQGRDGLLRLQPSLTSDSQRPVFVEGKESPSRRYMLTPPTARPTELLLSTTDHARRASCAATGSTEATVPMHRGATPSVDSDVPPRTPTVGAPPRGTAQRGTASPCGTCTPSAATVSDNAQSSVGDDAGSGGRSGGAARYPCRDCGQLFRQPRDVKTHARRVHGQPQRLYGCESCDARFRHRCDVVKHTQAVHLRRRPFVCQQCNAAFGQRGTLNKHVRAVHDKQRQHRCDFCEATFAEAGNRNKHVQRMHSGKIAGRSTGATLLPSPSVHAAHHVHASRSADDTSRLVNATVGGNLRAETDKDVARPALPYWSPQGR